MCVSVFVSATEGLCVFMSVCVLEKIEDKASSML